MRQKISKRIKKWCALQGAEILKDEYALTKEEYKDAYGPRGWIVKGKYHGLEYWCVGKDRLEAYQMLRDCIKDEVKIE